jgi:hypothetical protein
MEETEKKQSEAKLSIDEQLAIENEKFEARMKAEGVKITKKLPPKPAGRPKALQHKAGEVAHSHYRENDFEIYEYDCKYVSHQVRDRKGFTVNGKRFQGKVLVPQCVADYLSMMENRHRQMERGIFENRGKALNYGEVRG